MTDNDLGRKPVNRPPDHLGGAFGKPGKPQPNRAAGLAGLDLAPPPAPVPAAAPPEPTATTAEQASRAEVPDRRAKTSRRRKPGPAKPRLAKSASTVNTTIYLPQPLYQRLRADAAATGRTYTVQLLDALDAHHQELPDLVQADEVRPADSLFVGRRTIHQIHTDGQAQITVRLTRADLAVIDQLAAQHVGGNRSALAAAALDAHLPPTLDG